MTTSLTVSLTFGSPMSGHLMVGRSLSPFGISPAAAAPQDAGSGVQHASEGHASAAATTHPGDRKVDRAEKHADLGEAAAAARAVAAARAAVAADHAAARKDVRGLAKDVRVVGQDRVTAVAAARQLAAVRADHHSDPTETQARVATLAARAMAARDALRQALAAHAPNAAGLKQQVKQDNAAVAAATAAAKAGNAQDRARVAALKATLAQDKAALEAAVDTRGVQHEVVQDARVKAHADYAVRLRDQNALRRIHTDITADTIDIRADHGRPPGTTQGGPTPTPTPTPTPIVGPGAPVNVGAPVPVPGPVTPITSPTTPVPPPASTAPTSITQADPSPRLFPSCGAERFFDVPSTRPEHIRCVGFPLSGPAPAEAP